MSKDPYLHKITIYPIKSLDGVELQKAIISKGGCLLHDREYAISDSEGNFIIGKSNPHVHLIRSEIDFEKEMVSFRKENESAFLRFHLVNEKAKIESYLGDHFGFPVFLHQNKTGRFLDIPDISGVTVVSTSSLQTVSGWYNNMNLDETRKRFRATLEIGNTESFWEDHLFTGAGRGIEFRIGNVTIFGMKPRARCVVPTRHPQTGEVIHAFPKTFASHRASTLPEWSGLNEHGHHYFLSVDCYIPDTETGKWLETGDTVEIIGEKFFHD